MARGTDQRDTDYWATRSNTDCIEALVQRRKDFSDRLIASGVIDKIARSWDYYHAQYFSSGAGGSMAIKKSDDEAADALANVNYTRAIVDQHVTFVLSEKPAWDTRAINSSGRAREKAILFNQLLDSYMEVGGVEEKCRKFATYAAVLSTSFMYISWDRLKGSDIRPDTDESMITTGDLSFECFALTDVCWDLTNPEYEAAPWVQVRTLRNRWDLIELYPSCKSEILDAPTASESKNDYESIGGVGVTQDLTDFVVVWEFWHRHTKSLPQGRHIAYIDDKYPLIEKGSKDALQPNPYKVIPLVRLVPSEYLLTCLGYTFAFDMQVPQEIYGASLSALLTSFNVLGMPRIVVDENANMRLEDLEPGGGIQVLRTSNGLEPHELRYDIKLKENAECMQIAKGEMGEMAGIGPTSRGVADPNLKDAPAAALAILDSKAQQSTSIFEKRYRCALSMMGTVSLYILKVHATEYRLTALAGRKNRGKLLRWSAEDLETLEIVVVEKGSPLQRSLEGKVRLADALAAHSWVNTKEEYLTVIETGQVESMTDTIESQLATIAEENDRLRESADTADQLIEAWAYAKVGGDLGLQEEIKKYFQQIGVVVLDTDNHILHAKRVLSLLDSSETRMTRGIAVPVMAHAAMHLDKLKNPLILQQQILLGYLTPEQLQQYTASVQIPMMGGAIPPGPGPGPAPQPPSGPGEAGTLASRGGPPTNHPPISETGRPPQARRVSPKLAVETVAGAKA